MQWVDLNYNRQTSNECGRLWDFFLMVFFGHDSSYSSFLQEKKPISVVKKDICSNVLRNFVCLIGFLNAKANANTHIRLEKSILGSICANFKLKFKVYLNCWQAKFDSWNYLESRFKTSRMIDCLASSLGLTWMDCNLKWNLKWNCKQPSKSQGKFPSN